MSGRYETSPASLRALRDRLTAAAKREGVVFGRLQQHVGVLVVTQFMESLTDEQGEPLLLVKGGASLELRRGIAGSRTSKDLDAVVRGDMLTVHDRLADAGADGWEGFTAVFTPALPFDVPGLVSHPHRFTAKLSYQGKPFVSVPIEVSPIEAGNADGYDKVTSEALTLVGLPTSAAVPCMTLPWQIAQKIHACTAAAEPPRTNDRAHDLVDLQLLEALAAGSSEADGLRRLADDVELAVRRVGLLGRGPVHDVAGAGAVVPDATGDELLTDLARAAGALLLVLVDVARRNDLIAGLEPRVRPLGRAVEQHKVAVDRIELGERRVDLLAVLLDTDPTEQPRVTLAGEGQLRRGRDETVEAHLGGNRHHGLLTSRGGLDGDPLSGVRCAGTNGRRGRARSSRTAARPWRLTGLGRC